MPRYVLLVTTNAKAGQDDDYNRWYDHRHLEDVCRIPGITGARRYVADEAAPITTVGRYLAIYDLDTDDPAAVLAEMRARAGGDDMPISPALDSASVAMTLFRAHEPS